MTDLERLKIELERQDCELAACFEQMRRLDPELVIAVSPSLVGELPVDIEPTPAPSPWGLRA